VLTLAEWKFGFGPAVEHGLHYDIEIPPGEDGTPRAVEGHRKSKRMTLGPDPMTVGPD